MAIRQPIPKNTNRPSTVAKRTIVISKTSVSLEAEFWDALGEIAASRGVYRSTLISEIGIDRGDQANLSSAVRLYVLEYFRNRRFRMSSASQSKGTLGE